MGASTMPADQAQLLVLCLECIVYGIFFPLFIATLWLLFKRRSFKTFDKIMIGTVIAMFLIATSHLALSMSRAFEAFTSTGSALSMQAVYYYENYASKKLLAVNTLFMAQTLLGDSFIIYRVFVVWNRSFMAILGPVCLLLGWFSVATTTSIKLAHSKPTDSILDYLPWITADYSINLGVSIICTILIAGRIWWTHRNSRQAGLSGRTLIPTMLAIVESGAIYSSAVLSVLVVYLIGSNGEFMDLITPLIGVVFTLIIVQVHMRRPQESDQNSKFATFAPPSRSMLSSRNFRASMSAHYTETGHSMPNIPGATRSKTEHRWNENMLILAENGDERDSSEAITPAKAI